MTAPVQMVSVKTMDVVAGGLNGSSVELGCTAKKAYKVLQKGIKSV